MDKKLKNADDWCKLLSVEPQYCVIFNDWELFSLENWVELISAQVQFVSHFDRWDELNSTQIRKLLVLYPALVNKVDVSKIDSDNWSLLLGAQVQFANQLTAEKIGEFGELEWSRLLPVIEDFEKIRADFGEEIDWDQLVEICPEYLEKYNKRKEQLIAEKKSDESAVMKVVECENDEIPYDPPEVEYHSHLPTSIRFRISLSTLTGITEEMQQKYNINSIKSLCEFDLSTAADEDKELLGKLQNTWQPGNWLFSNLPCRVLFVNHSDVNNIGRLYRAGIKTVGDFMACDDFSKTTLSAANQNACRIFRSRCRQSGVEEFIVRQQAYHEKLWKKKLEQYPVTNVIEPNYDFCKFENAPLNSFVLTDPLKSELQFEYRQIYPDWKNLSFSTENLSENPGNKRELKDIFAKNIKTLGDFLKYDFEVHDELDGNTKRKIKTIQGNIFPVEEPPIDIAQKILEIKSAQDNKTALKVILGSSVEDTYLDSYIKHIIEGKTQCEVAESQGVSGARIGQITGDVIDALKVKWWDKYCEEFFSKFGRISTINAIEAKGNELLGNGFGKVIAKCLEKKYKAGAKVLKDTNVHPDDELDILSEQLVMELVSSGKDRITKNEFLDVCSKSLTKYFDNLALDTEYISNDSLWDILKPAGRNVDAGNTVRLINARDFIRKHNILKSPMLRNDIETAMRAAGYAGNIPKNNFADRLDLVVYDQDGKEYKYILSEDLPSLPEDLLAEIFDYIGSELKKSFFINLEQVCNSDTFGERLQNITPLMLKAILKKEPALDVIYDNSSTQIWKKGEIISLQGFLEQKLKDANKKVLRSELFDIAKGYDTIALDNAVNSSDKILTGGERSELYYLHTDNFKPDMTKLEPIFITIENETVVSVKKLFDMHRKICAESEIEDARLLSSLLKKSSSYYVDYPTVSLDRELAKTLREMGEEFIKSANWRSKEEIDKFYEEQHYKSQWLVLQNHPDLFPIAENYVAHRENIGWKDEYAAELLDIADKTLKESGKKYMKIGSFYYAYRWSRYHIS